MKHFFIPVVFLLLSGLCFAQNDTIEYSIVAAGKIKGFDKTWKMPDGTCYERYQFNDRGRGDSIRIVFREDAEGFPTFISAGGNDYMKNPVYEEFSLQKGIAKGKNNAKDEQKAVTGKMFYAALKSGGGHFKKALKANNNKLNLLPFGTAELTVVEQYVLKNNTTTKPLWLVKIKGLGLVPFYSNPVENISTVRNTKLVITQERIYDPSKTV